MERERRRVGKRGEAERERSGGERNGGRQRGRREKGKRERERREGEREEDKQRERISFGALSPYSLLFHSLDTFAPPLFLPYRSVVSLGKINIF